MKVKGITKEQLLKTVATVSQLQYGGNVTFNRWPEERGGGWVLFTLRVENSSGPGHSLGRASHATGKMRHLVSACWHVHRDVFKAIFDLNPDARIVTGAADYKGREDFRASFWATATRNVGSAMYPQTWETKCDCA